MKKFIQLMLVLMLTANVNAEGNNWLRVRVFENDNPHKKIAYQYSWLSTEKSGELFEPILPRASSATVKIFNDTTLVAEAITDSLGEVRIALPNPDSGFVSIYLHVETDVLALEKPLTITVIPSKGVPTTYEQDAILYSKKFLKSMISIPGQVYR